MAKRWIPALVAGVFALTLGGCSLFGGSSKQVLKDMEKDQKATLKIVYWDEQNFMQKYGYMFMAKYPNIDVEVLTTRSLYSGGEVKDYNKVFLDFIQKEQPDVFMVQPDQLEKMSADQLLYELDPVIQEDGFDIQNIQPAIIEYIKMKGNGKLYGLSPTFSGRAMFVNKDLFDKNGVELPQGKKNWDEILQLAQRFPTSGDEKSRIYGYAGPEYQSDPYTLILQIATDSGLKMENQGKVTLQTPSWKSLVEQVVSAFKSGAVLQEQNQGGSSMSEEEWLLRNKFVAGRAAMSMGDPYLLQTINQAAQVLKDRKFNWEIIPAPQGIDASPTTNFYLNELFVINAKSPNLRPAWEFLKYINGDEMARVHSKIPTELWSRTSYQTMKDGKSLEAFYQLTYNPNEAPADNDYTALQYMVREAFNQELKAVIGGTKTVDQALAVVEQEAFKQLDMMKKQKESNGTKG